MKSYKQAILLIGIAFFMFSSCVRNYSEIEITSLENVKEVLLMCTEDIKNINGLELKLSGFTERDFVIEQTNKANVTYVYKIDSGIIAKDYTGDWYSKECLLKLIPEKTDSLYLKIQYRFY